MERCHRRSSCRDKFGMARHFGLAVVLFGFGFLASLQNHGSLAAPARPQSQQQDQCSSFCRTSPTSLLKYEIREYVYDFESTVETSVNAQQPQSKKTNIKAEVLLIAKTPCSFVLKVKKLAISNDGSAPAPVEGLEVSGAQFTLEDGVIGSFCVRKDEPAWTANVKRAVVSLLQNKALSQQGEHQFVETDISGRCPTSYSESNGKYTKSKVLNECSRRDGGLSLTYGVPYDTKSAFNSATELLSNQTCEQVLENGIYKSIKCTETHGLDNHDYEHFPQLQTTVKTSLTHRATKPGEPRIAPLRNLVTSSVLFDYSNAADAKTQAAAKTGITDTLDRICSNIRPDGVTTEAADQILTLRNYLAQVSKSDLAAIYQSVESGTLCSAQTDKLKKLLLDTAAIAANDATIPLLVELVKANKLSGSTTRYFYLYTSFAPAPGVESLKAVKSLLSGDAPKKRIVLAASGMAHRYCKVTNAKCEEAEEYKAIVDRLGALAERNCLAKGDKESRLGLAALEALGNVDHLTPAAVQGAKRCLAEGTSRVRIAALKANRRDECNQELRQEALRYFSQVGLDASVRISAFTAVVKCLRANEVTSVQSVINHEKSVQVGGYVRSYLSTIRKASSPSLKTLQSNVGRLASGIKYPQEIRKYSQHMGSSLFYPPAGMGYSLNGDVIYAKDSFLPHQLAANWTLDLYGSSYNMLDVGVHLENFDSLQESLFGPEGRFNQDQNSPYHIMNAIMKQQPSSSSAMTTTTAVAAKSAEPRGDIYVRMFGTTVGLASFTADSLAEIPTLLKDAVRGVFETREKNVDAIIPILFLDDEVSVPTSSGLKLASYLQGSFVPSIEYKREYSAASASAGTNLKLKLVTNAAVAVKAKHGIVGGPFATAIQFEMDFRQGGAMEFVYKENDNQMEVRLNLPNERVRAAELSTDLLWARRAPGTPEVFTPYKQNAHPVQPDACSDVAGVNKMLEGAGLKFCVATNVNAGNGAEHNIPFFLRGKQYVAFELKKTEASMEGYQILFERQNQSNDRRFSLILDTPGSSSSRKVELSGSRLINGDTTNVVFKLDTPDPSTNLKIEYKIIQSDSVKSVDAKLTSASSTYGIVGEIRTGRATNGEVSYKPLLKFQFPGRGSSLKSHTFLAGKVIHKPDAYMTFDLTHQVLDNLFHVSPFDVFLTGTVRRSPIANGDYVAEVQNLALATRDRDASSAAGTTKLVVVNGRSASENRGAKQETLLQVQYGYGVDPEQAEGSFNYTRKVEKEDGKTVFLFKTEASEGAFLNTEVRGEHVLANGKFDSKYKLTIGSEEEEQHWILESATHVDAASAQNFDVRNELKLRIDETYDLTLRTNAKNVVGEEQNLDLMFLNGDNGKDHKVALKFLRTAAKNNDFNLDFQFASAPDRINVDLAHTRTKVAAPEFTGQYKHETKVNVEHEGKKQSATWITNYKYRQGGPKQLYMMESKMNVAEYPDVKLSALYSTSSEKCQGKLELKLSNKEIAMFDALYAPTPATPTSAQFKLLSRVSGTYSVEVVRKLPATNEAETTAEIRYVPTGRVIKFKGNRKTTGNTHQVDADLKWDAEANPGQSVQLHSVTSVQKSPCVISSKNDITVVGREAKLNFDTTVPVDIRNGEHSGQIEYISTSSKTYKIGYKNNLNISPALRTSAAELSVAVPDQSPVTINVNVQSKNPDYQTLVFDVASQVQVKIAQDKAYDISASVASTKNAASRTATAKLNVGGSGVPEEVELEGTLTAGSDRVTTKHSWKVGASTTTAEVDVELTKNHPVLKYKLTGIPNYKYANIEGIKKYDYQVDKAARIYKVASSHTITSDGRPLTHYSYSVDYEAGKLAFEAEAENKGTKVLSAKAGGVTKLNDVALQGELDLPTLGKSATFDLAFKNEGSQKTFSIGGSHNKVDKFSLKLNSPEEHSWIVQAVTKCTQHGLDYQLDSNVVMKPKQKLIKGNLQKNGQEVYNAKLQVNEQGDRDSFDVDGAFKRGANAVTLKGKVNKVAGGYEGSFNYQLPQKPSGVAKFTFDVSPGKRRVALVAGDQGKPFDFVTLEYTKANEGGKVTTYDGSFSSDLLQYVDETKPRAAGTFTATYTRFDESADGEVGRSFVSEAQVTSPEPAVFSMQVKHTDKEVRLLTKTEPQGKPACGSDFRVYIKETGDKRQGGVTLLIEHGDKSWGYVSTVEVTGSPFNMDVHEEYKMGKSSVKAHGYVSMDANGENSNGGFDVELPSRTISVDYKRRGTTVQINAWLDKVRQPAQKLTADLTYEKFNTADYGSGYSYSLSLSHPKLTKPMVIKRKVVRGGRETLLDSETELDIFSDPRNKIVLVSKLAWDDAQHLNGKASAKSEGLGIDFSGEMRSEWLRDSVQLNVDYNYKNREGHQVNRKAELALSTRHQSITIGDPATPTFLISRHVRDAHDRRRRAVAETNLNAIFKPRDVVDVRYELHLPGMVDNRVVDVYMKAAVPPHISIKTFASDSSPRRTLEFDVGFPSEQQFVVGVYKQVGADRTTLSEVKASLNTSNLLAVKADWNAQAIRETLKQAHDRVQQSLQNAEASTSGLRSEVAQNVQSLRQKLRSAGQDFKPLKDHLRAELAEIEAELTANPDLKILADSVNSLVQAMDAAMDPVEQFFQDICDALHDPELAKKYQKALRQATVALGQMVTTLVKNAKPIIEEVQALLQKYATRTREVDQQLKNVVAKAEAISDSVLAKLADLLVERMDHITSFLESSSTLNTEIKQLIRTLLRYTVERLRGNDDQAEAIHEEIVSKTSESLKKLVGEIFTIDLENEKFAVMIPLPRPVNSLYNFQHALSAALRVPKFEVYDRNRLVPSIQVLQAFFKELSRRGDLSSAIVAALRTNAPPHAVNAYIIGSQYFITFDGKQYHLEGKCKYALIKDTISQDLAVYLQFGNSNGRIQKTITVDYKGRTVLTINPDFTHESGDPDVRVGEDTAIPNIITYELSRKGYGVDELSIVCNKANDVCTIRLDNGYRFGKIAGLLGTYNNEQQDDFSKPDGQVAENVQDFAASWKVGSCTEAAEPGHASVSFQAKAACASAFSSPFSYLRSCFRKSNPTEFQQICEKLSTESGWTVNQAVCSAAYAYEQTCPSGSVSSAALCA